MIIVASYNIHDVVATLLPVSLQQDNMINIQDYLKLHAIFPGLMILEQRIKPFI